MWISMPVIDYDVMARGGYDKERFPVLEGGDIIVLGKKILVGSSRNPMVGSSTLGIAWLKSVLEPHGYDVEAVPLRDSFLHLDVTLSIPRQGLVLACPEALINGLPSYFDGWKVISVSAEESQRLAVNGLPIDEKHYILGTNGARKWERIVKALENEGITVYSIPFENHNEDGGSIRCATHPLIRRLGR
jgi:N-dimethylarginine dimethylaminohydrolase